MLSTPARVAQLTRVFPNTVFTRITRLTSVFVSTNGVPHAGAMNASACASVLFGRNNGGFVSH
eukprot:1725003-Lingulodinium_polyedra.AAC.1